MAERPLGFRPPAHAGGEANPSVEGGARSPPQSGSAFLFVMLLLFVLNSGGGGGGGETLIGSGGGGSGGRKEPVLSPLDRGLLELDAFNASLSREGGNSPFDPLSNSSALIYPTPSPYVLANALSPFPSRPRPFIDPIASPALYPRNITGFFPYIHAFTFNLSSPLSNVGDSSPASRGDNSTSILQTYLSSLNLSHPIFHPLPVPIVPFDRGNVSWSISPTINASASSSKPPLHRSFLAPSARQTSLASSSNSSTNLPILVGPPYFHNATLSRSSLSSFPWLPPRASPSSLPPPSGNEETGKQEPLNFGLTFREGWWGVDNQFSKPGDGANRTWSAVKGTIEIGRDSTGEGISYHFHGTHHLPNGTLYLLASPESDRIPLSLLPSFFPLNSTDRAQIEFFVFRAFQERVDRLRKSPSSSSSSPSPQTPLIGDDDSTDPDTTCPLQLVLQLKPLPADVTREDLDVWERETLEPTGLPTREMEVRIERGVWWSWECGIGGVVDGETAKGLTSTKFWRMSVDYATITLLVQLSLVLLQIQELTYTSLSQARLAKIAVWTVGMQALLDGWMFSSHVMVGILVPSKSSMALIATGFIALLGCAIFTPRWAMLIVSAQPSPPSRPTPPAPAPPAVAATARPPPPVVVEAPSPLSSETTPSVMPGSLPTPTAVAPPRPPPRSTINNSNSNTSSTPYPPLLFLFMFFLLLQQTSLLGYILPFILFVTYSFWFPQIMHSALHPSTSTSTGAGGGGGGGGAAGAEGRTAMRGRWGRWLRLRKAAFRWRYVLGVSVGRMWVVWYFLGGGPGGENVFFLERSGWYLPILLSMSLQLALLFLQSSPLLTSSPAFFLPRRYAPPPPYEYHPPLPSDVEAKLSGKEGGAGGEEEEGEGCAICMSAIEGGDGDEGRLERAVAPCGHQFHTECLRSWLAVRQVCPYCRVALPPMED